MADLERPFIAKGFQYSDFGVSVEELKYIKIQNKLQSSMFVPDNIRDGLSIQSLNKLGKISGLLTTIKTDAKNGIDQLNTSEMNARLNTFGNNKPIIKAVKTIWEYIKENFEDEMLQILSLAAFVALIVGIINEGWKEGWLDGLAIFIAVIIIVSVTAGNNYMKDQQFRKLNAQSENRNINVIRNSKMISLNVYDLVVGDIVQIETGEILPVDGLLFKGNNMSADESSITGETNLVRKAVPQQFTQEEKLSPFLISGSRIMEGTGEIVVLAIGENSQWGQAKKLMNSTGKDEKTPLQEKLAILADDIGSLGMKMAILTFASMTIHLFVDKIYHGESFFTFTIVEEILNFFIVAVTIVVVAVPEGLPLAVTIALAYSVGKMKEENNLVRFLQACETMGGANNICSDKTGTLTKNQMTVTSLFIEDHDLTDLDSRNIGRNTIELLSEGLCLNSNAHPQIKAGGKFDQIGNKTECALLEMCFKLGQDFRKIREEKNDRVVKTIPFSSSRKRMSIIYDSKGDKMNFRIYCKGAPDILLEKCTHYLNADGKQAPLSQDYRNRISQIIKKYADGSLRTLLITYKDHLIPGKPDKPEAFPPDDDVESRLIIIGLAGIKDPLRDQIKEAVAKCHTAGVTVRMVTGDNLDTAVAISKEAGILPAHYVHGPDSLAVLEGKVFRNLVKGLVQNKIKNDKGEIEEVHQVGDLDHFRDIAKELRVLARSSPEDKFLLVTGLKQLQNVVAVTGDGTNDAPALKKADVGFAMGIAGTEVAKEASGIILLDDNFSSIVTAIKWGRNIFDSIRKFLQFQVTVNICACFMAFLGGVILKESPLTSIQMLWVNLIMDTLASLALATEPPSEELLQRKPYARDEYIINAGMWRNIVCQAIWQIVILTTILFKGDVIFGVQSSRGRDPHAFEFETSVHYTLFFHTFVFLQVFNEINCRKLKRTEINVFEGFFNNPLFIFVIGFTIVIQIILIEFGGKAIKVAPLSMDQHIICIFIGLSSLIVGFAIKQIPDASFERIKLFREHKEELVDPTSFRGMLRRPSTLLRKKRDLEGYKKSIERRNRPNEIELKQQIRR